MTDWPTVDMSLICPTCSTLNRTDAHFCATCGTPFESAAEPTNRDDRTPDTAPQAAARPDVPGPEAPGREAPGREAPGREAPGREAPGREAPVRTASGWSAKVEAFFNDEPTQAAPGDADGDADSDSNGPFGGDKVGAMPDTTMACPSCGAQNDPAAPFCGTCGAELPVAGAVTDAPSLGELLGPHAARIPVRGVMSLGRDPRNSITIRDASISRVHARLDCRSGIVLLSDLQSTNGTWVNGQRIDHEELSDGDRLLVGRTEFVFRSLQRHARSGGAARAASGGGVLGSVEDWLAPEASDAVAFPGAGTEPVADPTLSAATSPVYDDPWDAPAPHAADPWQSPNTATIGSPDPVFSEPPSQVDSAWAALGVPVTPPEPAGGDDASDDAAPSSSP